MNARAGTPTSDTAWSRPLPPVGGTRRAASPASSSAPLAHRLVDVTAQGVADLAVPGPRSGLLAAVGVDRQARGEFVPDAHTPRGEATLSVCVDQLRAGRRDFSQDAQPGVRVPVRVHPAGRRGRSRPGTCGGRCRGSLAGPSQPTTDSQDGSSWWPSWTKGTHRSPAERAFDAEYLRLALLRHPGPALLHVRAGPALRDHAVTVARRGSRARRSPAGRRR